MKAIELQSVTVERSSQPLITNLSWQVQAGQRWVVLGANGAGKTTLLKLVYGELFPTAGLAYVLGQRLGQVDLRELRKSIGLTGAFLEASLRPEITALEAVMSAKHAAKETWWHSYEADDEARARELLATVGCELLATAKLGDCSSGERQRILLARALLPQPQLLILDEPMANLDIAGREQLLAALADEQSSSSIYAANPGLTSVLVTHHTEEIPASSTHLLLLKSGQDIAAGKLEETLTEANLSQCFGLELKLEFSHGRWRCLGASG